jgi:hypothetical protein
MHRFPLLQQFNKKKAAPEKPGRLKKLFAFLFHGLATGLGGGFLGATSFFSPSFFSGRHFLLTSFGEG